ncbi:uncharacterized protein LOC143917394 isoform X1 [Arctopsyche grandis]|uniref:uncharacterized protein LOC143917394 isoform X1 n=1 Tax=Arctopsyche grandis TaxID=121162 RepID=UPI00406D6A6C
MLLYLVNSVHYWYYDFNLVAKMKSHTIGIIVLCIFINTIYCVDKRNTTLKERIDKVVKIRRIGKVTSTPGPTWQHDVYTPLSRTRSGNFNAGRNSQGQNPFQDHSALSYGFRAPSNHTSMSRVSYTPRGNFNAGLDIFQANPFGSHSASSSSRNTPRIYPNIDPNTNFNFEHNTFGTNPFGSSSASSSSRHTPRIYPSIAPNANFDFGHNTFGSNPFGKNPVSGTTLGTPGNFNTGYGANPFASKPAPNPQTHVSTPGNAHAGASQCVIDVLENRELNQPLYISETGIWKIPDETSKMNFAPGERIIVDCGRDNTLFGSIQIHLMKLRKAVPLHTTYTLYTGTYGSLSEFSGNLQIPLWFYKVHNL